MDELTFGSPEMAWAALAVLGLTIWGVLRVRNADRALARLGKGAVVKRLVATAAPGNRLAVELLVGLAALLLVGAATRPRYGLRETEVSNAGIDVVFVVDASKSMLVRDIVPNRLRGTMLEISALLDKLAGGRVALVPFAGIPFVQCPLTTDHEVIRTYLSELKVDDMPVGGTNVGRAITTAADLLTGQSESTEAALRDNLVPEFKGSKHKAIVVFSDGEDHEGDPVEAAKKAATQGIHVYTIGVGSSFGDPVPVVSADGSVTGTLKDDQGNPIFSKLDLEKLQAIASASGGKSFHYANKTVVPELFAALDSLEKAEYRERFKMLGEDRFQWLLGPALLLLLAALAIGERKRSAGSAAAAASAAARASLVVAGFGLGLLLAPTSAQAAAGNATPATTAPVAAAAPAADTTPKEQERSQVDRRRDPAWLDRENPDIADGRDALQANRAGEALTAFQQAQKSRPEHAVIWYDIGLAQAILGQHKDAAVAFSRCLSAMAERDADLEADLHYAAGTSQMQWGQSIEDAKRAEQGTNAGSAQPEPDPAQGATGAAAPTPGEGPAEDPGEHYRLAVESLQKALTAAPQRADVRRNLELAVLLAYPPCELRDTAYEPNNQPGSAKPLELKTDSKLSQFELRSCPMDRDVFSLDLEPGDRLTATLAVKPETETRAADPLFGAAAGAAKLRLALLDATGSQTLRGALAPEPPVMEVQLSAGAKPERVLLDVRNDAGIETPYGLDVKILPACQRLEDKFEPNDVPAAAKAIPIGEPLAVRLCPRNDDHLAVDLDVGQGLLVKAKRTLDLGSDVFELAILDDGGNVLSKGVARGEGWMARLAFAPTRGRYIVRLRGGIDTEADVELQTQITPACALRDDPWEENDHALGANPMERDDVHTPIDGLQLCPGDDDWYRVELTQGESLFVDLVAQLEELPDIPELAGALTVTVYDSKGEIWGEARGGPLAADAKALTRMAAVLEPPPGAYFVRVTGGGVADPSFPLPPMPDDAQVVVSDPPAPADPGAGGMPMAPPGPGTPPVPGGITATPLGRGAPPPAQPAAPAEPPRKVRRVVFPSGFPAPAVTLANARIDLGYRIGLRILPPCPDGNDEREPNNQASEAKRIEVGSEQLNRICKGDVDWLEINQKAGQKLMVSARYDFAHGALSMTAHDEAGTKEMAKGETSAPALPGGDANTADDTPKARRGRTATTALGIDSEKADRIVKLRISAADEAGENFYILRVEEPPPPSDDQKKNDQQEQGDDKDQNEKKDQQNDKKDQDKDKEKDKKDQDDAQKDERDAQRAQMQRHDRNPRNLEAEEAMRKSPFRNTRPTRDW